MLTFHAASMDTQLVLEAVQYIVSCQ